MSWPEKKPCMACKNIVAIHEKKASANWLDDFGGTVFSGTNYRPSTKFHFNIITKRHAEDLRALTSQEWADILPVLKAGITKIENHYKRKGKPGPLGYRVSMPVGKDGNQDAPQGISHFYMRVVPKYAVKYSSNSAVPESEKNEPEPEFAERKKALLLALQPNQNKVIAEKSKIIAKLHDHEELVSFTKDRLIGKAAIYTKNHLPNDINSIDPETWNEIGQMLKELMKKVEQGTECRGFNIGILLGKEAVKLFKEEMNSTRSFPEESELVVCMNFRFKPSPWWIRENRIVKSDINKPNKFIGSFENERLAFKLRDPEAYDKIWGKKLPRQEEEANSQTKTNLQNQETKDKESIWKQPTFYWGLGGGLAIAGLGFMLFSSAAKRKKK